VSAIAPAQSLKRTPASAVTAPAPIGGARTVGGVGASDPRPPPPSSLRSRNWTLAACTWARGARRCSRAARRCLDYRSMRPTTAPKRRERPACASQGPESPRRAPARHDSRAPRCSCRGRWPAGTVDQAEAQGWRGGPRTAKHVRRRRPPRQNQRRCWPAPRNAGRASRLERRKRRSTELDTFGSTLAVQDVYALSRRISTIIATARSMSSTWMCSSVECSRRAPIPTTPISIPWLL